MMIVGPGFTFKNIYHVILVPDSVTGRSYPGFSGVPPQAPFKKAFPDKLKTYAALELQSLAGMKTAVVPPFEAERHGQTIVMRAALAKSFKGSNRTHGGTILSAICFP
jgi:hypothetical protein